MNLAVRLQIILFCIGILRSSGIVVTHREVLGRRNNLGNDF